MNDSDIGATYHFAGYTGAYDRRLGALHKNVRISTLVQGDPKENAYLQDMHLSMTRPVIAYRNMIGLDRVCEDKAHIVHTHVLIRRLSFLVWWQHRWRSSPRPFPVQWLELWRMIIHIAYHLHVHPAPRLIV